MMATVCRLMLIEMHVVLIVRPTVIVTPISHRRHGQDNTVLCELN